MDDGHLRSQLAGKVEEVGEEPTVTSQAGIDLIKQFYEGCELKAYPDTVTAGDPLTIGYGHTGPDVLYLV